MRYWPRFGSAILSVAIVGTVAGAEPAFQGIPYKPDPPPAIDGRLDEWENVPNAVHHPEPRASRLWRKGVEVAAGPQCQGLAGWRGEYLYLAADVTDDRHVQKGRGRDMWRGDHVELYLDAAPDAEPQRNAWGEGQMTLGFSPGNLQHTGDPLTDIPPEAAVFTPEAAAAEGVLVAAQKTEKGYALEAAIPWALIARLAKTPELKPTVGHAAQFRGGHFRHRRPRGRPRKR